MPDVVEAKKAEELGGIVEVLRDQEFRYADLSHDSRARSMELFVRRKSPPRKGWWLLEIRGVREWNADHRGHHGTDTVKFVFYDPGAHRLTLRCGQDEIHVVVDSLELRLSLMDGEPPRRTVGMEGMPAWFQEEVRQAKEEKAAVQTQRSKTRSGILWIAVAGGALFTLFTGLFLDANFLALLVAAPLFGGGSVLLLQKMRASPQLAGPIYGVASLVGCLLAGLPNAYAKHADSPLGSVEAMAYEGLPNLLTVTLSILFLTCWGMFVFMWIRGREEMSL